MHFFFVQILPQFKNRRPGWRMGHVLRQSPQSYSTQQAILSDLLSRHSLLSPYIPGAEVSLLFLEFVRIAHKRNSMHACHGAASYPLLP